MSLSPIQSIAINIPELMLHLADYLDPRDIVCCMATCKTLATHLEPCLWQHVAIHDVLPRQDSILRNRRFVRSLAVYHVFGYLGSFETLVEEHGFLSGSTTSHVDLEEPITKLRSLALTSFPKDEMLQYPIVRSFIDLAQRNFHSLRTLMLPAAALTQESSLRGLMEDTLVNSLPNLTKLTICSNNCVPWSWKTSSTHGIRVPWIDNLMMESESRVLRSVVFPFLAGCFRHPRLTSLHCLFNCHGGFALTQFLELVQSLEEAMKSKLASGAPRIKDLVLPATDVGYGREGLGPLLAAHSSSLESMGLTTIRGDYDDELEILIEEHCSKLQRLSVMRDDFLPMKDSSIIAVIRGCQNQGLKSFSIRGLKLRDKDENQGKVIQTLVDCHAETLEDVEFVHGEIASEQQHLILERCTNLKRMWIGPGPGQYPSQNTSPMDLMVGTWRCLGLRELRLMYDHVDSTPPSSTRDGASSQGLYRQIGRLENLEFLTLGPDSRGFPLRKDDMTLHKGCLGELAGLGKLRHVGMLTDLWSEMGQDDVEFMERHWPLLQSVSFDCEEPEFSEIRDAPHWRWLRETRPWLQLTRGKYPKASTA
ncbi:hypothetical protein BGX31_007008 [Mortierella sp. GBA43]|nr:hypothetical protein BGX31_007008 [Mortierella sp. GBA43]